MIFDVKIITEFVYFVSDGDLNLGWQAMWGVGLKIFCPFVTHLVFKFMSAFWLVVYPVLTSSYLYN